jgi:cell wall-associated NlpC family hydrolase
LQRARELRREARRIRRAANREDQQHAGVAVARDALQPGDLVFLHLLSKELHVGIAIDSTHFVHAPSSGGRVRIDSLGAAPICWRVPIREAARLPAVADARYHLRHPFNQVSRNRLP